MSVDNSTIRTDTKFHGRNSDFARGIKRMQISWIGIFLSVWFAIAAPVYFGTQAYFKKSAFPESLRSVELQNLQLGRAIESSLRSSAEQVALYGSSLSTSSGLSFGLSHPMARFDLVAEVTPQSGQWRIAKVAFRENSTLNAIATSLVEVALKKVEWSDSNDFTTRFGIVPGASLKKLNWLLTRTKSAQGTSSWYLAVSDRDILRGSLETFLGQESEVFLLNESLEVVSHTKSDYIGLKARDNSFISGLKGSENIGRAVQYKDEIPQVGVAHKIAGSNLFLVTQVKESSLMQNWVQIQRYLMIFLFAALVLGATAIHILETRFQNKASAELKSSHKSTDKNVKTQSTGSSAQIAPDLIQLASSISREINLSQAGVVSLIKNMMHSEEFRALGDSQKNWVEQVAKSIEDTRQLSENLKTFAGEVSMKASRHSPRAILEKLVRLNRAIFQKEKIDCSINCAEDLLFETDERLLLQALQSFVDFSVESLRNRPAKKIELRVEHLDNQFKFFINDNGAGLSAAELEKYLHPFTDLRSANFNRRFNLIQSFGIMRELGGEIKMNSIVSTGTEVSVQFAESLSRPISENSSTPIPAVVVAEPTQVEPNLEFMGHQQPVELPKIQDNDLFVNHEVEKLLDGAELALENNPVEEKTVLTDFHAQVVETVRSQETPAEPQFVFNKKLSILDDVEIKVRRPGEKMTL